MYSPTKTGKAEFCQFPLPTAGQELMTYFYNYLQVQLTKQNHSRAFVTSAMSLQTHAVWLAAPARKCEKVQRAVLYVRICAVYYDTGKGLLGRLSEPSQSIIIYPIQGRVENSETKRKIM